MYCLIGMSYQGQSSNGYYPGSRVDQTTESETVTEMNMKLGI